MTNSIEINNLKFGYNGTLVLDSLDMSISTSGVTGIIGPNGSGKSTLIKNIAGVLDYKNGVVSIEGRDLKGFSKKELAQLMGVVHQKIGIDYDFTIEEVVSMGRNPHIGRFHNLSDQDQKIISDALERTDLLALREKSVLKVSGGELQRTIIARALAQKPKIMLLDEPISHLDIGHQIDMMRMLRELSSNLGITIVVVLHELNIAMNYCDRLVLLDNGQIHSTGLPQDVVNSDSLREVYGVTGKIMKSDDNNSCIIQFDY